MAAHRVFSHRVKASIFSRKPVFLVLAIVLVGAASCAAPQTMKESPSPDAGNSASKASATAPTYAALDKAVVQVWVAGHLASTGVVVGDGTHVLTVLDYQVSTPETVEVVTSDGRRYTASVGPIDSRTAATRLDIEGARLPAAETGNATAAVAGQPVTGTEWQTPYTQAGPGAPELETFQLVVSDYNERRPICFSVNFPASANLVGGFGSGPGGVIADASGRVIGLVGMDYQASFPHPTPVGAIPQVASIDGALQLLSPDAANGPYADSPLAIGVQSQDGSGVGANAPFPNYDAISTEVSGLLGRLDTPLPESDLTSDNSSPSGTAANPADGTFVTIPYPRPVELKSPDGNVLATARWIRIQYGRSETKPDRLFYGDDIHVVKGGFYIQGGVGDLPKLLSALWP